MSNLKRQPVNVMFVEDDPAQARILALRLKDAFCEHVSLQFVTDPLDAKRRLLTNWVDVLVTDLSMPIVDGLELLKCVKKRNSCAQVILMTATSTTASLLEAMEYGAADYILKPLDLKLIIKLIHQADERLGRWRASLSTTLGKGNIVPVAVTVS